MDNFAVAFQNILRNISALPYGQQENCCNRLQFLLEDYSKKFPPASLKTYQLIFSALKDIAGFYADSKVILEIGPGFNLGVLFLAALAGAKKTIGVDCFPHTMGSEHDFIVSMYCSLMKEPTVPFINGPVWSIDQFTQEFAKIIQKDVNGMYQFKQQRLEFLYPYSAEKLPIDDLSLDLIYTSAAFEHFLNPHDVVKEMHRVTVKGGLSCHAIDMRDHRDFSKPLDYLKISTTEWDEINKQSDGYSYTNRLRPDQIIKLFQLYGFTLLGVKPLITMRPDYELKGQFVEPYLTMSDEDIFTLVQIFIFKKD